MNYFFITISCYLFFLFIQRKTKLSILNPVLLSITAIIILLIVVGQNYDDYMYGGRLISIFLGPATVTLALPLYKNRHILKSRGITVFIGILTGSFVAILSVYFLSKLFGIDKTIMLSLLPKSITTPIGMEISEKIGGIPALTVAVIVITGITGNILGPIVLKIFKIKDSVAIGAALGTASHAIGTSKALEIGEIEGAISGLSIGIAGLITSLLIPLLLLLL
ncbi:MAG: LrgB family protein [Spirochaetales bacterium]|nr:LrgB family protein [Spirochaetales bacterium]